MGVTVHDRNIVSTQILHAHRNKADRVDQTTRIDRAIVPLSNNFFRWRLTHTVGIRAFTPSFQKAKPWEGAPVLWEGPPRVARKAERPRVNTTSPSALAGGGFAGPLGGSWPVFPSLVDRLRDPSGPRARAVAPLDESGLQRCSRSRTCESFGRLNPDFDRASARTPRAAH